MGGDADAGGPPAVRLATAAAAAGLVVFPMERYSLGTPPRPELVLGYGGLTGALIRAGVERLARVMASLRGSAGAARRG
jgi:DNA-binding transcriptional MocR family regulator